MVGRVGERHFNVDIDPIATRDCLVRRLDVCRSGFRAEAVRLVIRFSRASDANPEANRIPPILPVLCPSMEYGLYTLLVMDGWLQLCGTPSKLACRTPIFCSARDILIFYFHFFLPHSIDLPYIVGWPLVMIAHRCDVEAIDDRQ